MAKPTSPTLTELYFEYPVSAQGSDIVSYWLASGGTNVRMTPACKAAFCATMEAVMERATAVANIADSCSGATSFKQLDWSQSQAPFSAIDLGIWELSSARDEVKNDFCRGCPKQHMDQLVNSTCDLFFKSALQVHWNSKTNDIYLWQKSFFDPRTYADSWVPDTELSDGTPLQEFEIPWNFSLKQTPCDMDWATQQQQKYAPWGSYKGPDSTMANEPMTWLEGELMKLGCQHIYIGSTDPQESMVDMVQLTPPAPQAIGKLEDGKLGNWAYISPTDSHQTTIRRSSSQWAVLQSMLANMQYTSLVYDYTATYVWSSTTRRYDRAWYIDTTTLQLKCEDMPLSADVVDLNTDINTVRAGSSIDYLHGAAAYDFKLAIPEDVISSYVRASRPMFGIESISDARPYALDIRVEQESGPGKSSVFLTKYSTDYLDRVEVEVPGVYPSPRFESYIDSRLGVAFVDNKRIAKPDSSAMGDSWQWNRAVVENGNTNLSVPTYNHCASLLNVLPGPRNFPQPGPIGNTTQYTDQWWSEWEFWYPEQPNWPYDDPNPTQYAPAAVYSPGHLGILHILDKDAALSAYVTDFGAGIFGTFDVAFPSYPYGWDDIDDQQASCSGKALSQYKWRWKAMPAT